MVADTNDWSTSYDKLSGSIATIIHPGPTASSSTTSAPVIPTLPQFDQADYKNIKFWHQSDYKAAHSNKKGRNSIVDPSEKSGRPRRGSGRLAETGENVQTDFIEDIEGDPVSGMMASAMRALVRCLLSQMEKDGMVAPESWGRLAWLSAGICYRNSTKSTLVLHGATTTGKLTFWCRECSLVGNQMQKSGRRLRKSSQERNPFPR